MDAPAFGAGLPAWPAIDFAAFGEVEVKPLSRIQGLTAGFLSRNWLTIPHVTHQDDADITALEALRKELAREQPAQPKLSPLAFFAKALVSGLKAYPQFNASLDATGKNLVLKKYFNIGVAIDTPRGLVVGVVRDCDGKSLGRIANDIAALSEKARGRGLPMSDMEGGSMSISSLGGIGGTGFTPIVNAPEVAILGITRAEWKPRRGEGDAIEWRLKAPLSLSYDHRVINGADAARFLRHLDEVLANPGCSEIKEPMATETLSIPAHVSPERVVDFDYLAPAGHEEDVHRAWHRLHDMGVPPIVWTPRNGGHWIATRADDIEAMQADHARFSHSSVTVPRASQTFRLVPLEMDPPEQTPFRALLSPKFGPRPVADLEGSVRALANELIDGFIGAGECEFVDAFAKRLPIVVFLRLVDLPLDDREELLEMTEAAVRGSGERRLWAYGQLQQYVGKWIVARRASPGPDLFSAMVNAKVNGRDYTPEETFGMLVNVIFGGLDTVAASLGFLTRHLAENPDARGELAANPALIPVAIEEFLRRFGVPNTARVITHDFEYGGVRFKAGEQIMLPKVLHGLDARRYPRPLKVDFNRPPSRHAAFGDGAHRCPGAGLARMEMRVFLEEWLRRIPEFSIKPGERPRTSSGQVNGMMYLPLVW